jgi:YfiR/HmsC-like
MAVASSVRVALLTTSLAVFPWCFGTHTASAQSVSDDQVKAAYIYNFSKFVEWPARYFPTPKTSLHFCVLNNRPFEVELERIAKGKSVGGHIIDIIEVQDAEQSRDCHLLFIDATRDRQTRRLLEALQGVSVLTIGESEGFLEEGGIINFMLEDNRVQFEINHKAANESGLYISSRLLGLARRVTE